MKIALVDDDPKCLEEMTRICCEFGIRSHCRIETFSFSSGEAFLKAIKDCEFPIVFMDIYMDGINGVVAALKMREQDSRCILVFLTSSMEFMPEAFSCHAFEYITKPFSSKRVEAVLWDAVKVLPSSAKYLKISSGRKTVPVFLNDIISILTDAHYLEFTLQDGTVLRSRMTIPEFQKLVGEDPRFLLVNKGILLNADYILDFDDNCCIMENGSRFPIRVRDRLKTEQAIRQYHFEKIRSRQHHAL